MSNGNENGKKKKWLLPLILVLALGAGTAGVFALTRGGNGGPGKETTGVPGTETTAPTQEAGQNPTEPAGPSQTDPAKPAETEPAGEKTPSDLLRERLMAEGEDVIELADDVAVSGETLTVNGKKTLTGSGRITAKDVSGDYIITIAEGASLVIDGPVIDGTGKAKNGILVSKDAVLDFESGELTKLDKLGIRVVGEATVKAKISEVGTNWIYMQSGGRAKLENAAFENCGEFGLQVLSNTEVTIRGGSFTGSTGTILYNRGVTDIEDAVFSDSALYTVSNGGTMTLKNVEISGAKSQGLLYNYPDCSLEMTDCRLHDSENYLFYNSGTAVLEGVSMESCASHAIYNEGATADLTMKNSTLDKIGSTAFFNKVGSRMDLEHITIVSNGNHALYNRAGTLVAKDITSTSSVGTIVCNDSATDTDLRYGTLELDGFALSGGPGYGISCYGGSMTVKNGTVDVCGSYGLYVKDGEAVIENVDFKGTSDPEGRATVQIGITDFENAVVTMTNVNITGGARGIGNHGTLTYNSGTISGNRNFGKIAYGGGIYNFNKLTLNGGTISGNESLNTGGGIYNAGEMVMNGGLVTGNKADTSGGGISNRDGCYLTINGGTISKNYAVNYGGGLYNKGKVDMFGGTISGNSCGKLGGGVHSANWFHLINGTITGNTAGGQGGGVYNTPDGSSVLSGGVISYNKSSDEKGGGGVYNTGKMTVENTVVIRNNQAASSGGGILNSSTSTGAWGVLTVTGGTIENNSAATSGGGIYSSASLFLSGGTINNNKAGNNGGGVYAGADSEVKISGGSFDGNRAGNYGGSLYLVTKGEVANITVKNSSCDGGNGGAVYITSAADITLKNSSITDCKAPEKGHAVYLYKGVLRVEDCTLTAKEAGAAVWNSGGSISLGGRNELSVYTENALALEDGFDGASAVTVLLDGYTDGKEVLSGKESVVAASYDKAFTLPEMPENVSLESDGRLQDSSAEVEAVLYDKAGTELARGSLTAMVSRAEAGQTVELIADAAVSGKLTIDKDLTIRDDGTPRAILVSSPERAFQTDNEAVLRFVGKGGLTIRAAEGVNFSAVAIYVIRGSVEAEGPVTVSGFSCDNTAKNNTNGAAIYVASSGKLKLNQTTLSGNTAAANGAAIYIYGGTAELVNVTASGNTAGKGDDIYLSNSGKLTIRGGSFESGSGPDTAIYASAGTLTLDGKTKASVYTGAAVDLAGGFDAASPVEIYLDAYTDGRQVLNGAAATIAAAVKGGAVTLPALPAGVTLEENGKLKEAPLAKPEAILYDTNGKKVDEGRFTAMVNAAQAGYVIELVDDVELTSTVRINKSLTIRDDGTARTLSIGDAAARGLEFYGDSGIEESAYPTITLEGTSAGGLTIKAKNPETVFNYVAIYVIRAKLITSGKVTVTDYKTNNSVTNNKNGGAFNIASSGTLEADGLTVTNITAEAKGAAIYNNGGKVILKNVTFRDNTSSTGQDVYVGSGTLTLGGKDTLKIYSPSAIALADDFDKTSQIALYPDAYTDGKVVLTGTASVIAAAVDGGAVTLPEAADQPTETKLLNTGILRVAAPEKPEACLYDAAGTKVNEGLFTAMVAAAEPGYTVELVEDVTLASTLRINKSLTIRDDGTARTIYIGDGAQRGLEFYGDTGIEESAYPTIRLEGTSAGGLTIRAKNPETVFHYVALYVIRAKLNTSGKVTVADYKTDNTVTNNKNGGAFNVASSGTLEADGLTVTNITAAAKGAAIYNNGGKVVLKNVNFSGNTSSTGQDVYVGSGSLTLGGKQTLTVFSPVAVALADDFDKTSQISLYLDAYADGQVVLTGTASVIAAAVDGGAVILPEAGDQPTETKLKNTGLLSVAAPEKPEAYLYDTDGTTKLDEGLFTAMLTKAADGQIVELVSDVTVTARQTFEKSITIRDDGTARTISVSSNNRAFQTSGAVTLTIAGSAAGKLTLTVSESFTGAAQPMLYAGAGSTMVLKNVTIKDYKNTSTAAGTSGAIYVTSSNDKGPSTVVLENVTMSGNSCAFKGQDIYLANKGILQIKNSTLSSGSGSAVSVYRAGAESVLSLDGTCTATIYTPAAVALADGFAADSPVALYLDSYTDGKVVLTGTASVVAAAVEGGITLPEAAGQQTETKLLATGILSVAAPEVPEAILIDTAGKETEGLFAALVGAAQDGDTIKLVSDVTVISRLTIKNSITITDDGTTRTIYVNSDDRAFQTSGTNTLTIQGTAADKLILTVKDDFAGAAQPMLYAGSGTTMVLKNVRIENYKNTSTAAGTSGTIYITSSGDKLSTVVLENVTMSGNSCAFKGQDIYLANKGVLQIKNSTLSSGSGSTVSVYRAGENSTLSLDSQCTVSIYTPAAITLADGFASDSPVTLYLDAYTNGKVVLTGTASVVTAAVEGGISLPDTDDQPAITLLTTGVLSVTVPPEPEAALYADASSTEPITSGPFTDMLSQATNGQIIVLLSDVTVAARQTIEKSITIRDDGTARTIYVSSTDRAFQSKGAYTLTIEGTAAGKLTLTVKDGFAGAAQPMLYTGSGSTMILRNVTIKDYKNTSTAAGTSGTIYATSDGTKLSKVILENVTMSGNSGANNGLDVYLNNKGVLQIKNSTLSSAADGKVSVYRSGSNSVLSLDGQCTVSIYTPAAVTLEDGFTASGSAVTLYLDAYTKNKEVLSGTASVIAAAVDGGAVTVPEAADHSLMLLNTGVLGEPPVPAVAALYKSGETSPYAQGSLKEMIEKANSESLSGATIKLIGDPIPLDATVDITVPLTITDDGTARTITAEAAGGAFTVKSSGVKLLPNAGITIQPASGATFSKAAVTVAADGELILEGSQTVSVYLIGTGVIKLADSFATTSQITVYLDSYTNGRTVLTGTASVVAAAVDGGSVTLPEAASQSTTTMLLNTGILSVAAPVTPEAFLYDTDGTTKLAEGLFAEMLSQATASQVIELKDDIMVSGTHTLSKSLTIRDDGTTRTITASSADGVLTLTEGGALTLQGVAGITFAVADGVTLTKAAVTVNAGTLTLDGKITATVYAATPVVLVETFNTTGSAISLYLNAYVNGKQVLSGTASVIAAAVNGGAVSLKGAPEDGVTTALLETGYLQRDVEAALYQSVTASTPYRDGAFTDMLAAATDGEIVELKKDITVSTKQTISKSITIRDDGTARTITASGSSTVFEIDTGKTVSILGNGGITIQHEDGTTVTRAAVYIKETAVVTLKKLTVSGFSNTSTSNSGAGIFTNGQLTMTDCAVRNNHTSGGKNGAAIYVSSSGSLTMSGGSVENNGTAKDGDTVKLYGGAVYLGGPGSFTGVTFTGNSVVNNNTSGSSNGGAVYITGANADMTNCVFSGNSATGNGGAVYMGTGVQLTLDNCTIQDNTAKSGPAVYNYRGALTLKDSTLAASGNAVYVAVNGTDGTLTLDGTVTARISLSADIPLNVADGFSASSQVRITRKTYVAGDQAVSGDPTVIANTYTAFTLNKSGFVVDSDGKIAAAP